MLVRFILRRENAGAGYQATVRIERSGTSGHIEEQEGFLPAIPASLDEAFRKWREGYLKSGIGLDARFRDLSIQLTLTSQMDQAEPDSRISSTSSSTGGNPKENVKRLRQELNTWLSSPGGTWLNVRDRLVSNGGTQTNNSERIRVLLQFDDPRLRRLPWRAWEVFQNFYSGAEIAFITPGGAQPSLQQRDSVRILLIVGNTRNIKTGTQADVETIESLRDLGARVTILHQPEPNELINALQNDSYEIFVYTGHSRSEQDGIVGRLELNENPNLELASITVDQLRENLGEAVKKGLQLCVFNSCDGLGLSQQFLQDLKLPVAIVMREPVPDKVAVKFLQYFFNNFARNGQSLFAAFHRARLGLEEFTQFPGIIWLPAICISSLTEPLTWQQLGTTKLIPPLDSNDASTDPLPPKPKSSNKWKKWIFRAVAAAVVVGLIVYNCERQNESSPTASSSNYPDRIKDIKPSPPNGSWSYGGSKSLVPLTREKVRNSIQQAFPDFHLQEYQPIGTQAGTRRLSSGDIDFILASEKDNIPGLDYKVIARDAIAVAVNPALKLSRGLTLDELKNIYTGKIRNWNVIGGPDLPIKAFYRSLDQSGTSEFFRQTVLNTESFAPTVKSLNADPTQMAQQVKNTTGAIYFGSASEVLGQCSVKPIFIGKTANDFILPYQGTPVFDKSCPNKQPTQINLDAINQNQYPIVRDVFVVVQHTNSDAKRAGESYANMLLTNEGQELIKNAGFAPLRSSP